MFQPQVCATFAAGKKSPGALKRPRFPCRRRCSGLRGCRRGERAASVVASEFVALDALLEFAEGCDGESLTCGSLFDGEIVVALHRAIDRDVLFDLLR